MAESTFDITTVSSAARGFAGGLFDGRFVYLVPNQNYVTFPEGLVARYDTSAAFDAATSWSTFDTTTVKWNAGAFWGGAFDGRYAYFVPWGTTYGVIPRYDTTEAFDAATSWSTFDTTGIFPWGGEQFWGGAFDGRFVYFVPFDPIAVGNFVARYDTTASFEVDASWSTFNPSTLDAGPAGFNGAVFDGRYLYLVPYYRGDYADGGDFDGIVARFDARYPPSLPNLPAWHGSFF